MRFYYILFENHIDIITTTSKLSKENIHQILDILKKNIEILFLKIPLTISTRLEKRGNYSNYGLENEKKEK